jgi:hypothetical protein
MNSIYEITKTTFVINLGCSGADQAEAREVAVRGRGDSRGCIRPGPMRCRGSNQW